LRHSIPFFPCPLESLFPSDSDRVKSVAPCPSPSDREHIQTPGHRASDRCILLSNFVFLRSPEAVLMRSAPLFVGLRFPRCSVFMIRSYYLPDCQERTRQHMLFLISSTQLSSAYFAPAQGGFSSDDVSAPFLTPPLRGEIVNQVRLTPPEAPIKSPQSRLQGPASKVFTIFFRRDRLQAAVTPPTCTTPQGSPLPCWYVPFFLSASC